MRLCLAGTYRENLGVTNSETCTACTSGQTTSLPGATSLAGCDLCAAGFGGSTCAACGGGSGATYGDGSTLSKASCSLCPGPGVGFAYSFNGETYPFPAPVVARSEAKGVADCLSLYAQIRPGTWWLDSNGTTVDSQSNTWNDCFTSCGNNCLFATWSYSSNSECRKRSASTTPSSE